jgi:hypothetical protein
MNNKINASLGKFKNSASNNQQFLDLNQIKKIEPKRNEKNSNKANPHVKIDNLNAKTAEIMKSSPAMANNTFNQLANNNHLNQSNKALINVNINNSNRAINNKESFSNYDKNLFKPTNQQNNSNVGNMGNSFYQNQKRKYMQMTNYDNFANNTTNVKVISSINQNDYNQNFQTPMPISMAEFQNKKFKYY